MQSNVEEFIEEHIDLISNWVHSCAQYALRNFTHEVELREIKNPKYRGRKFRGKKPRTPNGLPAYPTPSIETKYDNIMANYRKRYEAWEALPERPEDYYINVTVDANDDTIHDGRTVDSNYRDANGTFFVDLRLQYHNGELYTHSGNAEYDPDRRVYWSFGSVEWCATKEQAHAIAKDMLTNLFNGMPEGEANDNQ